MKALCLLGFVVALAVVASGTSHGQPAGIDWQKRVDETGWEFDYRPNALAKCIDHAPRGKYTVTVTPLVVNGRPSGGTIAFLSGGRTLYDFVGHDRSVFVIAGDRLFHSVFSPWTSGASFVAVDLPTGKRLWETHLKALGPVEHSAYSNRLAVHVRDGALVVFGRESMGGYVEAVDLETGKTLGHRTLTAKNAAPFPETKNTLYLHDWAEPPKATLTDVAWLAGRYEGKSYGGNPCRLAWSSPLADAISGSFSSAQDGKHVFSEFFAITEQNGTLVLRVRQFDGEARTPEGNPEHGPKKLVKVGKDAVYFNGRTFRQTKDGGVEVFHAARNPDGSVREDTFTFARVAEPR